MRVADIIADILVKNGITDVFTVTGGGAMHLNDALGKCRELKCLYNHHEQACTIAAEAYARIKNKPAAVCVTTGPGGINALNGVMGAYVDSIPMVVISGQVRYDTTTASSPLKLRQLGDQEFNIIKTAANMTKYSVIVTDPLDVSYCLNKAIYIATNGRPGPVWLDIPMNVQSAQIDPALLRQYDNSEDANLYPPKVTETLIDKIIEKIGKSQRPLILAGLGVRKSGAYEKFRELIDKANIPIATAWNAHDMVESENPLYAGKPATVGDRAGNLAVQNCDFLLILGSRLNIRQISYNFEKWSRASYKVYVDIDEAELNKPTLKIDMKVHADLNDFLTALNKKIKPVKAAEWHKYIISNRLKYPVVLPEYKLVNKPLNPYCFYGSLFNQMPEGQITVMSNGSACVIGLQCSVTKKGSRFFTNDGCASMGYGLPAAIGACIASCGKSTVCIEGDGSLQMNIQELQTVRHNNLDIKLFVLNNNGYHSIRQTQKNFFGKPLIGIGPESGDLSFPEVKGIAKAYKIKYFRIDSLNKTDKTIEKILKTKGPVICEAVVDEKQTFSPKLSSKKLDNGKMVSPGLEDMYPFLDREELKKLMYIPYEDS